MLQHFQCEVGLSDHTLGVGVSAVAHGATLIEKHFTLSLVEGGVDSAFSLEPHELTMLVEETRRAWEARETNLRTHGGEKNSLIFRRSIYISKDIKAGETLSVENLRIVRPSNGLAPRFFDWVLGKKAKNDLKMGTPLHWDSF